MQFGRFLALASAAFAGAAFGAGVGVDQYVQDGLAVMFDGIDNEGTGVHNPAPAKWVACRSGATVTPGSAAAFGASYFGTTRQLQTITGLPGNIYNHSVTLEAAVNIVEIGRNGSSGDVWPFLFQCGNLAVHGGGNGSRQMRFFLNNKDPRPTTGSITVNTFAGVSDTAQGRFAAYVDASLAQSCTPWPETTTPLNTSWNLNNNGANGSVTGYISTRYHAIRTYNRGLSAEELAWNSMLDNLRFWGPHAAGADGETLDWASLTWTDADGAAVAAPTTDLNKCATLAHAAVRVAASDTVALKALSLADGATLALGGDAVVSARYLFVEGVRIRRGVYTGVEGTAAIKVDWIDGAGVVRVADDASAGIPDTPMAPSADGWYEFGDNFANNEWGTGKGFSQGSWASGFSGSRQYVMAQYVEWGRLAFPAGAKARFVGGVVMKDAIPDGMFDEVDVSQARRLVFSGDSMFADGRPLAIPSTCAVRWMPGNWLVDEATGRCWLYDGVPTWNAVKLAEDLQMDGIFHHRGDNTHLNPQWLIGSISGTGQFVTSSFSNQILFDTPYFGFNGQLRMGSNGTCIEIRADQVEGEVSYMYMHPCDDQAQFRNNSSYCSSGLRFGPRTKASAPCELKVRTLDSASTDFTDSSNKRWRNGGTAVVWGGSTLHVGTLRGALHVVAAKADQPCTNGRFNDASPWGTGNLAVDTLNGGSQLFLSTNIYVRVGNIAGTTCFNYTFQSNAVNRMTLDVTGTCPSAARVYATDLAMLPARLSGFAGTVELRDAAATAGRTHEIEVDFDQDLYQTAGCIGSGTLAEAPAAGTVNVSFKGEPKEGAYSLFRFTRAADAQGASLFKDWTVNAPSTAGDGKSLLAVAVMKDATGLWLKLSKPGLVIIAR